MNVNKKLKMTGFALAVMSSSWGASAASDTATVNVTATVVDNTCTPQWSDSGVSVELNRVSLKDFGSDKVGAEKTFTLSLTDCGSDTTKVTVTASGTEDGTDSSLFSNLETDGAEGVAVAIWGDSSQSTQLTPDGLTSAEYTVSNQAVDMTFLARLMQTGTATPTAGSVRSTVTLTMDYE